MQSSFIDVYYNWRTNKINTDQAIKALNITSLQWDIARSVLSTSGSFAAEEYVIGCVIPQTHEEK